MMDMLFFPAILQDFSMETEAMSVKRASVSKEATQLLHLREADCPALRAQLEQLEVNWSRLTSDLCKIQDQLQQVQFSQSFLPQLERKHVRVSNTQ